jgi:bacterial/archaeal transporter family-2 protein
VNKQTGVALAVVAGFAIALQSRINGELGHRLGDGIAAAVISFGSGLIVLLFLIGWMRPGLRALRAALRDGSLLWWQCFGGVCGAFLVATQGLTVATLGVAVFTVAMVAGQTASSLAVDRAGLVPGGPHPVTRNRALGAFLCVVAVFVAVAGRFGDPKALGLAVLPALAGVGIAWQQGVNGLVRQAAGSALPATLINFTTGTAALLVVLGIDLALRGLPQRLPLPRDLWLYIGGLLGIVGIALATVIVARIGVLVMGLSMVAGQICGALVLDTLYPTPSGKPTAQTVLGAARALGAIVLAGWPARASAPVTPSRPAA